MKLINYIKKHHNGNTIDFASIHNVTELRAKRWLERNCLVIDAGVYCKVSKLRRVVDSPVYCKVSKLNKIKANNIND